MQYTARSNFTSRHGWLNLPSRVQDEFVTGVVTIVSMNREQAAQLADQIFINIRYDLSPEDLRDLRTLRAWVKNGISRRAPPEKMPLPQDLNPKFTRVT